MPTPPLRPRPLLKALLALALLPLAWAAAGGAQAAEFPVPGKPIRFVVGFPAGGGTDLQARQMAQQLTQFLGGVPVVVENRPGAGTMLAAMEVAKSAPDGHTLLYSPSSTLAQLPQTLAAVKYDPMKDFTPVAQTALGPLVLVLHKSIPASNVRELVAYAKAHPGEINYVSQGVGTTAHIFGQVLAKQAGIDIVHVPYKGANDVAKDFIAGRVHLQFASSSAAVALAKSGDVRMLAVIAPRRSGLFPDLPTMAEQGITGVDIDTELGFYGPANMERATLAKLGEAIRKVVELPKVRDDFRQGGIEPRWQGSDDFAASVRQAHARWGAALERIGFVKE